MAFEKEVLSNYILTVMGDDSVNAFAKKCGISRGVLSRIINQNGSQPPSIRTLRQIASGSCADINQLMTICGYPVSNSRQHMSLCDRIQCNNEDIVTGFTVLIGNTKLYKNIDDMLANWMHAYKRDCVTVSVKEDVICHSSLYPDAERCALVCFRLITAETIYDTYAVIYYVETKGGKIAAIGCAYDEYSFRDAGFAPVLYASSRMDSEGEENESKS